MNVSVANLINDAKDLINRLKERETNLDQVVLQSNALAKRVDAIQQLENEFIKFNDKANHKSKAAVLSNIQKENRVIKLLQQENEELRESLEEHQSVLELIMTKYREQMQKIIKLEKQETIAQKFYENYIMKNLQDKTDQCAEMVSVMKQAIDMDEKLTNENDEKLQCLVTENRGLRELLQIKTKYGFNIESSSSSSSSKEDKEVQTVPYDQTVNTEPETNTENS